MPEMVTRLTVLSVLRPEEEQDFECTLAGNVDAILARGRLSREWGLAEVGMARLYRDEEGNLVAFAVTTEAQ